MNKETKTQLQEIVDHNVLVLNALNKISDADFKQKYADGYKLSVFIDTKEVIWVKADIGDHKYESKSELLTLMFSNFTSIVGDSLKERNN